MSTRSERPYREPPLPIGTRFESDVPGRLDRLPWSSWHWRVVTALGVTWILDGLEATLVGAVAGVLRDPRTLGFSDAQIGLAGSAALFGSVTGALLFGRLTDRYGRKKLFFVTLAVYLVATLLTGMAVDWWTFAVFRALTGAGIGGEYAAINSAIDELLPARVRGRADLAINSTYWVGTAMGAMLTVVLLDPRVLPINVGWRASFVLGAALGLLILLVRRHLPESPRWLLMHGHVAEAERVVSHIEKEVAASAGPLPPVGQRNELVVKGTIGFGAIARVLLRKHPRRTVLGLVLVLAQAFTYNGVFFTYALVLSRFYQVTPSSIGYYLLPFALSNLLGPMVLGPLFDTLGRRIMIASTYAVTGVLLSMIAVAFAKGWLTATTQTLLWSLVFFVASAAASSSYLTVSELFPVELRGMAIALFYAIGTAVGGLSAPALFGALMESGSRSTLALGYHGGAALMLLAALTAAVLAVPAEGKSLEALSELP